MTTTKTESTTATVDGQKKNRPRRYAFDLDGTLCQNTQGKYELAKPYPEMLEHVNDLCAQGNFILIYTARGRESGIDWFDFTEKQLQGWGLNYSELSCGEKASYDILIDDKAVDVWSYSKDKKLGPVGMKVGFVASSFDLIHPGYVRMLEDAKKHCDYLVCGLHEDPSVERASKNQPIQTLEERAIVLGALKQVDEILFYKTEQDLVDLLTKLNPDVRILGSDYRGKEYTGKELGIPIHWHERDHSWSTSSLRYRITKEMNRWSFK